MPIHVLDNPFPLIAEPPSRVWVEAESHALQILERLPARGFAVVGTRAPQRRCETLVRESIGRLRGSGLVIVSGLARGIDSVAHEAALENDLVTVAVLGNGTSHTYPPENRDLRRRILAAGGLILSEFEPDVEALPGYFVKRNRIIAGLSAATWVVQAGWKSGALSTASQAASMGREVFATPGFPGDPAVSGNEKLLRTKKADIFWAVECLIPVWRDLEPRLMPGARAATELPLFARPNPLLIIEAELKKGATLAEALMACSRSLDIPIESLLRDFENAKLRA